MNGAATPDAREQLRQLGALDGLDLPAGATVQPLRGHASTRLYYRVRGHEGRAAVLAVYPGEAAEQIARYVRAARWFRDAGIRVPAIHAVGERAVLLEDVEDRQLVEIRGGPQRRRLYRQAMVVLGRLTAHGHRAAPANRGWALDRERLRRELAFTEEHAIRGWLDGGGDAGVRERWFDTLAELIAALPTVTCHRDFHARNLMVYRDRLVVIDFQDVMSGPVFYDAASLLWDNYCDLDGALAGEMLATAPRWALRLKTTSRAAVPVLPGGLPPAARQAFCLVAAQRHLKALGTFGYQVSVAGNHSFARFAPRTMGHVRRALRGLGWGELELALGPLNRLLA